MSEVVVPTKTIPVEKFIEKPTTYPNDKAVESFLHGEPTVEEKKRVLESLSDEEIEKLAKKLTKRLEPLPDAPPSGTQTVEFDPKRHIVDFSNIREKDIFNLDIPIVAIEHAMPEHLTVDLQDPNFVARWVHTSAQRLGTMKSNGWDYVVCQDLAHELAIEVQPDVSGHFVFNDVVLMKIPKKKYFGQLKANHLRAMAMTGSAALHEKMKKAVESEIPTIDQKEFSKDFAKYNREGKMTTYSPLVGA